MNFKKVCTLLLLIAVCFSAVSCAKEGDENNPGDTTAAPVSNADVTTGGADVPVEPEPQPIVIAENGQVNFSLIYYGNANDTLKESINALYTNLVNKSHADYMEKMSDESITDAERNGKAILIGNTVCEESQTVLAGIGYGDWKICFSGNKLVIAGNSQASLEQAITEMILKLKEVTVDGVITLPDNFSLTGTSDEIANAMPRYDGGKLAGGISEGQDTSLVVVKETGPEEYAAYLTKLESLGWTRYTSNDIVENRFATYQNDQFVINAGYYAYDHAARITVEKKTNLPGLQADNVYTANPGVVSSIMQMGLSTVESEYVNNGMCYAIQLADGSFIVVDGGYYRDAERLYAYLKSMAPDGNIVIAAWFVTHNDGDHRQCINSFASAYKDEVKIEQIIMNFPGSYTYTESGGGGDISTELTANTYPGCKRIKAHTGQKFYLRNAEVEILYTLDSYLPTPLKIFNNSSLVFSVTLEDEKILFLGDAGNDAFGIINPMYGDYLKSDIVQLSHHGLRNGTGLRNPNTERAYGYIQASVVLWPTGETQYLHVGEEDVNYQIAGFSWNLAATRNAREVYVAGDTYLVMDLPYHSFTARRFTDPAETGTLSNGGSNGSDIHVDFREPD